MGKRRPLEAPPKEPSPATAAAEAMIDESLEQHAKPPKTTIHRMDPETGERKYVARVATDVATEEWVARKFGPGNYSLTHMIAGPTGSYEYKARSSIIIDESAVDPKPADDPLPPAAGASSPAVTVDRGGDVIGRAMEAGVIQLLEHSARQNELTIAIVKRLTEEPAHRGPGMLELLAALSPIILEFVKSRRDPTQDAIALATLLSKQNGAAGVDQLANMLERGLKLGERFAGGGSGDGGIMPVVGEGVKVLGGIVEAIVSERRVARGEPVDGRPPLALVPPTDTEPMPTASATSTDRVWVAFARPQLPTLLGFARFMPPSAAADTIVQNLTPAALDDLLEDIHDATAPGFAQRLAIAFPQVESLPPAWFGELIRELLEITTEEEEPPTTARNDAAQYATNVPKKKERAGK